MSRLADDVFKMHRASAPPPTSIFPDMDLQARRKLNLKALIKQWEGPTNLAKKLQYSGPSYLSQLIGPHKPITEKTARFVEKQLDLPNGWMDADHSTSQTGSHARVDSALISRVMLVVGAELENVHLRPSTASMADLVSLVYDDATGKNGSVDTEFVVRLVNLIKKWRT